MYQAKWFQMSFIVCIGCIMMLASCGNDDSGTPSVPEMPSAVAPNGKKGECGPYYIRYEVGPGDYTEYVDVTQMVFDVSDVIDDYDFVYFTTSGSGQYNSSYDRNQDGFSDQDFYTFNGTQVIWIPANGARRITAEVCDTELEGLNPNCGFAIIRIQAKRNHANGHATIPMTAFMTCPDGSDCSATDSVSVSYQGCAE